MTYSPPAVYERHATVVRVVDGDTLHLNVDLGCDIEVAMTVRLSGLNAPEMSTVEGKAAKAYVEQWVEERGPRFVVRTEKDKREKYGRYLADLLPFDAEPFTDSLCQALLTYRYAVPYSGGKR